jgi:hypothetical protein
VEKQPKIWAPSFLKKLAKENKSPIGEYSPHLVTQVRMQGKSITDSS